MDWDGTRFEPLAGRAVHQFRDAGGALARRDQRALPGPRPHALDWYAAGGLNRYKGGKFTACMSRDGLFSDEVYEILEDDFGYFWMSCRKGIFRVSKKQLDDFIPGGGKAAFCTAFGRADGLPD